jgi:hypothetical protein
MILKFITDKDTSSDYKTQRTESKSTLNWTKIVKKKLNKKYFIPL